VQGLSTHISFNLEKLAYAMDGVVTVKQEGSRLDITITNNGPSKPLFDLIIPPELGVADETLDQLYGKITRTIILSLLV